MTGDGGLAIVDHITVGNFTVYALYNGLQGNASGTLAADEQHPVLVQLDPTAVITGTVKLPTDAPADGGTVYIDNSSISTPIAPDGTFTFDNLHLGTYTLSAYDAQGRLRARFKTPIVLSSLNQVATADMKFVGLGTVSGHVSYLSDPAQGVVVQIHALNPDFSLFRQTTTNGGGDYSVENIPVGEVAVSAANAALHLRAEGSGTIEHDAQPITVDLILQNNLIDLPTTRWDANNFTFDIQKDASILNGTNTVFAGIDTGQARGGSRLDVVVNGAVNHFTGSAFGTTESKGRQIVVRQDDVAGLNITRKVLVSNDGYFARYLEIVNNPTPDPITADLRVSTDIARNLFNSDASPSIIATSSGDNVLDVSDPAAADRWVVVDDVHPEDPFLVYSFPAVAEVFDGEGGAVQTTAAQLDPSDPQSFLGPRRLVHEWGSVTIPSNGTIALMHFLVQETSRPGAQAAAERLAQLPPEALAGLTGDDLAAIQNFDMPQGGVSTVAPLPSLTGIVSGTVRASNGAAVAGSITRFRSQNQLFGRTFQKTSGADGTFTFAGSFSDNGTSLPVPADAFTLTADHPNASGLITAQAAGQFEDGAAAAQQDVAFTNTGVASGVVRLNGAAVAGVQVTASAHIGSTFFNFSTPSAADGSFTFLLLPEGAFAFTSTVALPQGGAATGSSAAAIAAGQTAQTSIDIDTIPPQVAIVSPAAGASIDPRSPLAVIVHATDQIGVAQIVLQASGAATSSETRSIAPAATTRDEAFSVPFATLPPTGGTLTLSATATDRGGNHPASPTTMTLSVLDVVAPGVVSVSPASGAGEVEPTASLFVHFSEPIARGSITAASISLASGGVAVPVGYAFSDADATVVITPSQTLTLNRTYTLTVATAVTDAAGNHLAVPASSTFKTKSPDTIPPKVASIIPANGAVGVPVGSDIEVTFTEPIDRSTVTAASFRVTINAVPVAGRISFATNDALLRFVPDAPLPFDSVVVIELTSEITDLFQNGLVDANGNPLATPLTFTFLTGTFGITSPAQGTDVLEYSPLTLAAQATASLNITSVVFTVNGQALAPISGPPFTTTYNVGAAATTPALTISAVGRNASGAQVADDTVTVPVVVGLRVSPRILGVPHGGSAKLRLFLPSPIATDLSVQLATVDPNIATPSVASATIPAGQTEAVVTVNGASVGATTITASSSRGTAWAVASVSDPVAKTLGVNAAPTLVAVTPVRSLGRVFATTSGQQPITVPLLASPATGIRTVGVTTTNPAVANVTAAVTVAAGSKTVTLPIVTGIAGTATLTVRSGDDVVQLTVVVGPPFDPVPPTFAAPVGVVTLTARSLGRVFTPTVGQTTIGVALLSTPATSSTPVTVTTSDANVVSVVGAVTVAAGSQVATVTLATGAQGTATLTFNAGGEVRQLTVVVGTPAPGTEPLVVARPVGVVVLQPRQTGNLFTAAGGQQNVNVTLLASPAVADMPVAIATTNSNVASVTGAPVVHAGERAAALNIITGVQGVATITLSAGSAQTQIVVVVGTPPAALVPIVIAPIVGVRVQQ